MDKSREGIVFGLMTAEEQNELREAHKAGKVIEYLGNSWIAIENPSWGFGTAYRIEPEPAIHFPEGFEYEEITEGYFPVSRDGADRVGIYRACNEKNFVGFGFVIGDKVEIWATPVIYSLGKGTISYHREGDTVLHANYVVFEK